METRFAPSEPVSAAQGRPKAQAGESAAQPTHAVTLRLTGSRADVARALAAACRSGVVVEGVRWPW